MPGESSSETRNPYGRMHVTEPVSATIPVQNGARLSWDPWIAKEILDVQISSAHAVTEVPDLLQAGIPRDGLQCTEHLIYMGTTCVCAVVLNDLEEFGLFEADEKSVSRQMPTCRSQMS